MVAIKIRKESGRYYTPIKLGELICEHLAGERAFVDNDIVVNYDDDPNYIWIILGSNREKPEIVLEMGWPEFINDFRAIGYKHINEELEELKNKP